MAASNRGHFGNIPCFDFNQDERSSEELRVPADMDAFIDAEFEKIYEGEEKILGAFGGERQAEASYGPYGESTLLEQVELLDGTSAAAYPDSVFANIGDCEQGAEKSRDVDLDGKHQVVCCQCSKLQKPACFFDPGERAKEAFKAQTVFDRDKDPQMNDPNPGESVVTEEQLSDIREDVGTCYKSLAPKLGIRACIVQNIDEDYNWSADKAHAMLLKWKQNRGPDATVMVLVKALGDIGRRDIADKLLPGFSAVNNMPSEELALELQIKCQLTVNSHMANQVLLCEGREGKKYIVKELVGTEWSVEEILHNENTLARALSAVEGVKKSKDHKRQESLKRIRAELDKLQERLKKHRVEDKDEQSVPNETKHAQSVEQASVQQHNLKELEELLKSCEFQCQCWEGMYNGLIKLIGEVGTIEDSSQVVRQLTDFTKELQQQEKRFFPRIVQLEEQHEKLSESQLGRLAKLKIWQKTQSRQVEGIEKLLTCLLEQRPNAKALNRRSEPNPSIWPRLPSVSGRRRSKTDSGGSKLNSTSSLNDIREAESKCFQISAPLNARRMCLMETDSTQTKIQ